MELFEAIHARRSIRRFTDEPVERDVLERLLDAARWAPNGGNRNAWRFIVVTSETQKELLLSFAPGIGDMPAAVVVICMEAKTASPREAVRMLDMADAAIAAQNMCLAAHALGVGSYIVASFAGAALRTLLELPAHISPHLLVCLGYGDESPEPPPRRPVEEIAFVDQYGEEWA